MISFSHTLTGGSSVTLADGYIKLELIHATTIRRFILAFRTLLPSTVLATFGDTASLEVCGVTV